MLEKNIDRRQNEGVISAETPSKLSTTPWWLIIILLFIFFMGYRIFTDEIYFKIFKFVRTGLRITIQSTFYGFIFSLILGLVAGLGRISKNVVFRNIADTYVEFIRGVPILVLMMTVAFVIVPTVADMMGLENNVPQITRGMIALAIIYGGFMAEIFRAGIESVAAGQMEAARSLGMTYNQSMVSIILPQAIRNIMPALGNNFISMLKDSSLLSVLAVEEITQRGRLYAGSSFRFRETYLVLTFLYLSMTLILSLLLKWYEKNINQDR